VFANNDCTTSGGGFAGLELENTVKNMDVYGNYFHGLASPAIAHVHTKEINVKIHVLYPERFPIFKNVGTLSLNWKKCIVLLQNLFIFSIS
jgi:hypothetical protein